MKERTAELARFNWSPEFDSSQEEIIDLGPCIVIAKPIRLTKPGRDLVALAPRSAEIQKTFVLKDIYKMTVYPLDASGYHFHEQKQEIIYPLDNLELYFYPRSAEGIPLGISAPERIGDTCFGFYVKPGVAHVIQNPSGAKYALYVVLSNMFEEEAIAAGDVIDFDFELPPTQPLLSLLESAKQLK